MIKTSLKSLCALIILVALYVICDSRIYAGTTFCGRVYIAGFKEDHDRALKIIGLKCVSDPKIMSVYVTVRTVNGQSNLYLQSNYKPNNQTFPDKIWSTDNHDLNYFIFALGNFKEIEPFDRSHVTYFVEPSFFIDSIYGRYKDQLIGRVCVLDDDGNIKERYEKTETSKIPVEGLKPIIPDGWTMVSKGTVQNSSTVLPQSILDASRAAHTLLVAVDSDPNSEFANVVFEENPQASQNGYLTDDGLMKIGEEYRNGCSCQIVETKVFNAYGRKILRVTQDKIIENRSLRSVMFFFKNGQDFETVTGTSRIELFGRFGPIFQEAFKQTLLASQL